MGNLQGRARFQLYQKLLALAFATAQGWGALLYIRPYVPNFDSEWLITSLATLVAGSVTLGYVKLPPSCMLSVNRQHIVGARWSQVLSVCTPRWSRACFWQPDLHAMKRMLRSTCHAFCARIMCTLGGFGTPCYDNAPTFRQQHRPVWKLYMWCQIMIVRLVVCRLQTR